MTNNEFIWWLKGYLQLEKNSHLTLDQVTIVKNHLDLVLEIDGHLIEINKFLYDIVEKAIQQGQEVDLNGVIKMEF